MVCLNVIDGWLVACLGSLVGIVARDAAPDPVTRCRTPGAAHAIVPVERAISGDEVAFHSRLVGERSFVKCSLRYSGFGEEVLASIERGSRNDECRSEERRVGKE